MYWKELNARLIVYHGVYAVSSCAMTRGGDTEARRCVALRCAALLLGVS